MGNVMEREKVPGPPKGWRPRDLKIMEKLEIIVKQRGLEPGGARLEPLDGGVHFDHQPAIQERRWDPEKLDTIPPSCDLNWIVALNKSTHGVKTAKRDIREIAKTRRLDGTTPPKRLKAKIPGRPFPKRKKPPR